MSKFLFEHIYSQLSNSTKHRIEEKLLNIKKTKESISDLIDEDFHNKKYDSYFDKYTEELKDDKISIFFKKSYYEYFELAFSFQANINAESGLSFYFSQNLTPEYYNVTFDTTFLFLHNNHCIGWNRITSDNKFEHPMSYVPDVSLEYVISHLKYGTLKQDFIDISTLTTDKKIDTDVFNIFSKSILNTKSVATTKNSKLQNLSKPERRRNQNENKRRYN